MTRMRVRLTLLATFVVAGGATAVPAPAGAFVSYYDCYLKPSGQWCDGRANGTYDGTHSWDYNKGSYPGAWDGTVTACQRLYRPSNGTTLSGDSCGLNVSSNYYGNITCVCYDAEVRQYSGGPHSIDGYADADW
jgi:hypothetical protein